MYPGYMVLSGTEVFNAARTYAYASHAMPALGLRDLWHSEDLPLAAGDDPYESPQVDGAPWYDPNRPDTWGFLGLYPLAVEGGSDGTWEVTISQLSGDGAVASNGRRAGIEVVVRGLMVAVDEAALEAGMAWLRSVLTGALCDTGARGCGGGTLCYLTVLPPIHPESPDFTSVEDCVDPYHRTLYEVSLLDPPRVLRNMHPSVGAMREVTFSVHAGVPYAYGLSVPVEYDPEPPTVVDEVLCEPEVYEPIHDPDCPEPPTPPSPPAIPDACLEAPETWTRYVLPIPADAIPLWSDAVPVLSLTTGAEAARQVRIRFRPNPFGYDIDDLEECNFCGEFIVSYVPANSTMVIDGIRQVANVSVAGGPDLVASHLLYGSAGTPLDWPLLTCGTGYIMTVDIAPDAVDDVQVGLALAGRD